MITINNITLTGNVGKDSSLKYTKGGTAVLNFSMAVERSYQKDKDNKVSDWFNVVIFAKFAEVMADHIKKGTKVLVSGEMHIDYDKETQKTWTKVIADTVEITKWAKEDNEIKESDFSSVEDDLGDDVPFK